MTQINQYTKIRTAASMKSKDKFDIDSTEDGGLTYESARLDADQMLIWLNANIATIYSTSAAINEDRVVNVQGNVLNFTQANLRIFGFGNTSATNTFQLSDSVFNTYLICRDDRRIGINTNVLDGYLNIKDIDGQTINSVIIEPDHNSSATPTGKAFYIKSYDTPDASAEDKFYINKRGDFHSSSAVNSTLDGKGSFYGRHLSFEFLTKGDANRQIFFGTDLQGSDGEISTGIGTKPTQTGWVDSEVLSIYNINSIGTGIGFMPSTQNVALDNDIQRVGINLKMNNLYTNTGAGSTSNIGLYIDVDESTTTSDYNHGFIVNTGNSVLSEAWDIAREATASEKTAQLLMESTTKGFRPPSMNEDQMNAIVDPIEGLVIYQNIAKKLAFFNGTNWETVTST